MRATSRADRLFSYVRRATKRSTSGRRSIAALPNPAGLLFTARAASAMASAEMA
jgi:hypothetical protein